MDLRMKYVVWLLIGAGTLCTACSSNHIRVEVGNLRCEYLTDPIGIDVERPRLSWVLRSSRRGVEQSAYQVLVSGSRADLSREVGDLWDSGKVASDRSTFVVYGGAAMVSGQRGWWKVRVWDEKDEASEFSEPAFWELGLLKPEDWRGKWIGARPRRENALAEKYLRGVWWIWFPSARPQVTARIGEVFMRREIDLPTGRKIKGATFYLTADDRFVVYVNGKEMGRGDSWLEVYEIEVTEQLKGGSNVLAILATNEAGSAGLIGKLVVEFEEGDPLAVVTDKEWKVTKQNFPNWRQRGFVAKDWKAAKESVKFGELPWRDLTQPKEVKPAPLFRKWFSLGKEIASARAYICGLGYYELYLNGEKVGDHVLDPAFTRYDRRALYVTYDVTDQLRKGGNAVGVMLGNGWYNMPTLAVWNFDKPPWRNAPKLICQLEVKYADGTSETIVSDESWKVTDGPIVFDSIRSGEIYDARLDKEGWCRADYDDGDWWGAVVVDDLKDILSAQMMPPIKVMQTIRPVKITEPKRGVYVFDMGQNFAGWAQLKVKGQAGAKVVMKYGERLNKDGTVRKYEIGRYVKRGDFQTDTYICKGGGTEVWEPRFVYHGFRYVELSGLASKPSLGSLLGRVVHTSYDRVGGFECSDETFNQLQRNMIWSYGSNYHGYPTDCPHREKNGWTGDAHLAGELAMYNFDNCASYAKWMNDFADEQRASGEVACIIPTCGWGYHWGNGPAWDSAYILIPWYMYLYNGDLGIFKAHYERMKLYVDYITFQKAKNHIVYWGLGDWVPAKTVTPPAVTSTAYYYVDAAILSKVAGLLGKADDAARYGALAGEIKKAFNTKFYDPKRGLYAEGTQTAMSCALYQGLVEDKDIGVVVDKLVADIEGKEGHLDTGVLGAKYILHALTANGRVDVAYEIASQKSFPSWGYWIAHGATTLWEDWEGKASLNHIFFGDISAWFYNTLAGINPDANRPGFKHILFKPHVVGDLSWVGAEVDSIRGKIASSWQVANGVFKLQIEVPANSTATVYLPGSDEGKVTESGVRADRAEGVRFVGADGGRLVYMTGSGRYAFEVE
ncbi:MAG: family 78 glycoside hydrolase catalytic domain [Planctomycetota bacterium]